MKKSTAKKLKNLIYPLAFILILILSVVYKFVLKGSGDFSIEAFKTKKTAQLTEQETSVADVSSSVNVDISAESSNQVTVQIISVYICGEVNAPGIYEAPKGVMLYEVIEDAGGLTEKASVNNINLVYQLQTNMSIYIPSEEEIAGGFSGGDVIRQDGVYVWGGNTGGMPDGGSASVQMVNINTASFDELKTLPGIGDVTAQSIIDYRNSTPFTAVEDIKNVSGIGESKFNRIKDYICV